MRTSIILLTTALCSTAALAAPDDDDDAAAAKQKSKATSSVTMYGRLSVGIYKADRADSAAAGPGIAANTFGQTSDAGHLGFIGREDLGDGNYTGFHLETRFKLDTGTQVNATTFWFGQSNVYLGGKWGRITAGRDNATWQRVAIRADPTRWIGITQLAGTYTGAKYNTNFGQSANDNSARRNNMVSYKTPVFDGWSGEVSFSAGEELRGDAKGINLIYDKGPVFVGVAADRIDRDNRLFNATAAYNFGPFEVLGTIADSKSTLSGDAKSRSLSLAVPVRRFSRFWINAGQLKPKAENSDQSLIGLGYRHGLSNRTWLFVSGAHARQEGKRATNVMSTGITHFF